MWAPPRHQKAGLLLLGVILRKSAALKYLLEKALKTRGGVGVGRTWWVIATECKCTFKARALLFSLGLQLQLRPYSVYSGKKQILKGRGWAWDGARKSSLRQWEHIIAFYRATLIPSKGSLVDSTQHFNKALNLFSSQLVKIIQLGNCLYLCGSVEKEAWMSEEVYEICIALTSEIQE